MPKYQAPNGYLPHESAGYHYKEEIITAPNGQQVRHIYYFNDETGEYTQQTYPLDESVTQTAQSAPKKKKAAPIAILACVAVIVVAGVFIAPRLAERLPSGDKPVSGDKSSAIGDKPASGDKSSTIGDKPASKGKNSVFGSKSAAEVTVARITGEVLFGKLDSSGDVKQLEAGATLDDTTVIKAGYDGYCILNLGKYNRLSLGYTSEPVIIGKENDYITIELPYGGVVIDSRDTKAFEDKILFKAEDICNIMADNALYAVYGSGNYVSIQVLEGTVSLLDNDNNLVNTLETGKSYAVISGCNIMKNNIEDVEYDKLQDFVKILMDDDFANSIFD